MSEQNWNNKQATQAARGQWEEVVDQIFHLPYSELSLRLLVPLESLPVPPSHGDVGNRANYTPSTYTLA